VILGPRLPPTVPVSATRFLLVLINALGRR
jgi:hypothetical protein